MKIKNLRNMVILVCAFIPWTSHAIKITGKTSSKVTAFVNNNQRVQVTAPDGGWYNQPLELQPVGPKNTRFELDIPIKVETTTGAFVVSLDSPVVLTHQESPEFVFRDVQVRMGNSDHSAKVLSSTPTLFVNTIQPSENIESSEVYVININALPPENGAAGGYIGEMSLTFEPEIEP